ncbi:MAG TPA: hypothetical protein VJ724_03280, partial [Tahibacter sp.]|nr:hypothetical protein [Tahibacter sp.]
MWKAILALAMALPCLAHAELLPDAGFGNTGVVDVALPGVSFHQTPRAAVLPDRRVVVAVVRGNPMPMFSRQPFLWLVRLRPDGGIDPTFADGAATTLVLAPANADNARLDDVGVRADGSAFALVTLSWPGAKRTLLVGIAADGRPDPGFNGGEPLVVAERGYENPRVFDTGSGYLVVGVGRSGTAGVRLGFDAWRLRADGTPDPSFGNGGSIAVEGPADGIGSTDVIALPGGGFQILNFQQSQTVPNYWRRYRADGSVDTTFGNGGVEAVPDVDTLDDVIRTVYPLDDGTHVAVGGGSCALRTLDAQGRTSTRFDGPCIGGMTINPNVQPYGAKILVSAEIHFSGAPSSADGTYLWVIDRNGVVDETFPEPQADRWRPPASPGASYGVA